MTAAAGGSVPGQMEGKAGPRICGGWYPGATEQSLRTSVYVGISAQLGWLEVESSAEQEAEQAGKN